MDIYERGAAVGASIVELPALGATPAQYEVHFRARLYGPFSYESVIAFVMALEAVMPAHDDNARLASERSSEIQP